MPEFEQLAEILLVAPAKAGVQRSELRYFWCRVRLRTDCRLVRKRTLLRGTIAIMAAVAKPG